MFIVSRMQVGLAGALLLQLSAGTAALAEVQTTPATPPAVVMPQAVTTPGAMTPDAGAPGAVVAVEDSAPKVCFLKPAALDESEVTDFLKDPGALLTAYPNGGMDMVARVRSLTGTSLQTVDALLKLAETATREQRAAIGSGMARAAMACVSKDPEYAAAIQEKIALSGMSDVEAAFLAVSGDFATASLGATGRGASASSAPGITGNGPAFGGTAGIGRDEFVLTDPFTYSLGSGSTRFFSTTSTDVSPVQP